MKHIRSFYDLNKVYESAEYFGIKLLWEGSGIDEVARNSVTGDVMIRVNPEFYRPVDVVNIQGDATKVREVLGWQPHYTLQDLVNDMCENDFKLAKAYA